MIVRVFNLEDLSEGSIMERIDFSKLGRRMVGE